MKRFLTYLLFSLLSFAYCYESSVLLLKAFSESSICINNDEDSDCKKEKSESDKEKKDEKLFLVEHFSINSQVFFEELSNKLVTKPYSASPYSVYRPIFSPPPEVIFALI